MMMTGLVYILHSEGAIAEDFINIRPVHVHSTLILLSWDGAAAEEIVVTSFPLKLFQQSQHQWQGIGQPDSQSAYS